MASLHVSPLAWVATIALAAAPFAIDLPFSGRRRLVVEFRAAVVWSLLYVATAIGDAR